MLKLNHSQRAIINQLKCGNTKTRKELCSATELSWAAVSKTSSQLQKLNIISDADNQPQTTRGRRPTRLNLNEHAYMAGVAINRDLVEVAVYSLKHTPVAYNSLNLQKDDDPVPAAVQLLKKILSPKISNNLFSIGVAFPGIIEADKKYVEISTHFPDFEDRPIGEEIKLSLGIDVPIFVERNAVCDLTFLTLHKNITEDTLLLSLKSGVSAAVFIDGKILHGRSGNIGEFGHLNYPEGQIACKCGKIGCIETEIGGLAWKKKYAKEKDSSSEAPLFYRAIAQAEPTALRILEKSFKALYPALGHLTLLLRPDILAFSSHLPVSSSLIAATAIRKSSRELGISKQPEICLLEDKSTVAGAASIGLLWLSGNRHYR